MWVGVFRRSLQIIDCLGADLKVLLQTKETPVKKVKVIPLHTTTTLPFITFDTFSPELVEAASKSHIWVKRLLVRAGVLSSRVIGFFHLLLFDLGFFLGCLLLSFHSSLQLTVIRGGGRGETQKQTKGLELL